MRLLTASTALACGLAAASVLNGCGSSGGSNTPPPAVIPGPVAALARGTSATTTGPNPVSVAGSTRSIQPGAGPRPTLTTPSAQVVDPVAGLSLGIQPPAGAADVLIGVRGTPGSIDVHIASAASRSRQSTAQETVVVNITDATLEDVFGTAVPTDIKLDITTADASGNQSGETTVDAAINPLSADITNTTFGTGSSAALVVGPLVEGTTPAPKVTPVTFGPFVGFILDTSQPADKINVGVGSPLGHFAITPTPLATVAGKTDYKYAIFFAIPPSLAATFPTSGNFPFTVQTVVGGVKSLIANASLPICVGGDCSGTGFSLQSLGGGGGGTCTTTATLLDSISILSGNAPAPTLPAAVTAVNGIVTVNVGTAQPVTDIFFLFSNLPPFKASVGSNCGGAAGPYTIKADVSSIPAGTYKVSVIAATGTNLTNPADTSQEADFNVIIPSSR